MRLRPGRLEKHKQKVSMKRKRVSDFLGLAAGLVPLLFGPADPAHAQASAAMPAIGREAMEQITEIEADKDAWSAGENKMDSHLVYAERNAMGMKVPRAMALRPDARRAAPNDLVTVDIDCWQSAAVPDAVIAAGGRVINHVPRFNAVRAELPLAKLE